MSREPDDLAFREMFTALRERVIIALEGLEDRVRDQLDDAGDPRAPVASDAGLNVVGQILGLILAMLKGADDVDS